MNCAEAASSRVGITTALQRYTLQAQVQQEPQWALVYQRARRLTHST